MKAEGFEKGKYQGISAMYNICTDLDLGIRQAAMCHIPCSCKACVEQLAKPWKSGIEPEEQERYARNEKCKWWKIFEGLNDWKIVTCMLKTGADDEEIEDAQEEVLQGLATMMSESIKIDGVGAFMTGDPDADGYYIIQWTSIPYTLQEDQMLDEYDPPLVIPHSELVCEAKFWEKVPQAQQWYYLMEGDNAKTFV